MKPSGPKKKSNTSLRKQAEKMLAKQQERLLELSATDLKKLVHELGTHEIELEMQNEELRRAQMELESSRAKYADLYDFSPVGYFSFDKNGLVKEVNLTGAEMLGTEKRLLLNKPIISCIDPAHRTIFRDHLHEVFRTQTSASCEITMLKKGGTVFHAELHSLSFAAGKRDSCVCRTAVSDVTGQKRAEERERLILELQDALSKIKTLTGLLPICSTCKKIRNDSGYWEQVEKYISEHTNAMFTHGMCPECYIKAVEEVKKLGRP